jgi:hypothetical protein
MASRHMRDVIAAVQVRVIRTSCGTARRRGESPGGKSHDAERIPSTWWMSRRILGIEGPLAHPPELTYPCCLPALGEFGEVVPHEGSAPSLTDPNTPAQPGRTRCTRPHSRAARSDSLSEHGVRYPRQAAPDSGPVAARRLGEREEDSPSGLWRTLGKRVGLTPSGVRIPHPPQCARARSRWNSNGSGPFVMPDGVPCPDGRPRQDRHSAR